MYDNMSDSVSTVFQSPKCLIEAIGEDFVVNAETLRELSTTDKILNVVSIVGLYRSGKSYLLTRLAGTDKGNATEAKTKGVWAWCVPHPVRIDQQLLLLDTAGFGDIQKGSKTFDNKIFTIAALLSSTLVYNVKGTFDDDALKKLSFVLELAKHIKTSENKADEDGGQLDVFLPEFLLILRDFCLDLEVEGKEVTAKEYLENCLRTKHDSLDQAEAFNEPRLLLRKYFKRRNCFPIVVPASGKKLNKLDSLKTEELDPDFLEDIQNVRDYVIHHTEPFQTAVGVGINGRMFATLVEEYVTAISYGAVPCIDMTMKAMLGKENLYVVAMAFKEYDEEMNTIKLPTITEAPIYEAHISAHATANKIFLKHCVMDKDFRAKQNLDTMISETFSKRRDENEKLSRDGCLEKIKELHEPIAKRFEEGTYFVKDGFSHYERDVELMTQIYNACETIGFMKEQVRFSYLQGIEKEKHAVLEKDNLIKKEEKQRKLTDDAQRKKKETERMAILNEERVEKETKELQIEKEVELRLMQIKIRDDSIREKERFDTIIRYKEGEIERLKQEGKERERKYAQQDMARTKEIASSCIMS